jgi:hypothetical protein
VNENDHDQPEIKVNIDMNDEKIDEKEQANSAEELPNIDQDIDAHNEDAKMDDVKMEDEKMDDAPEPIKSKKKWLRYDQLEKTIFEGSNCSLARFAFMMHDWSEHHSISYSAMRFVVLYVFSFLSYFFPGSFKFAQRPTPSTVQ